MIGTLSGPLESRPNPSQWADLFDFALPALDHPMADELDAIRSGSKPRWTLGGGTALALRLGHRISDDIDIFLSGVRLAELSPHANPASRMISQKYDWPGYYLKFHRLDEEIDFLNAPL